MSGPTLLDTRRDTANTSVLAGCVRSMRAAQLRGDAYGGSLRAETAQHWGDCDANRTDHAH
jgi:hypothetical protein